MTNKSSLISWLKFICGVLAIAISISGCSIVKKATSDAYNLGYQTGEGFTQLEDLGTLIDSYTPDEADSSMGSITEEGVRGYCDAIWPITGLSAGIINSTENKQQFINGCADGYKAGS